MTPEELKIYTEVNYQLVEKALPHLLKIVTTMQAALVDVKAPGYQVITVPVSYPILLAMIQVCEHGIAMHNMLKDAAAQGGTDAPHPGT